MTRYFFHVYDEEVTLDEEGAEFPGIEAARAHAIASARSLICDSVLKGRLTLGDRIEVADESGARCLSVAFRDAVAIED